MASVALPPAQQQSPTAAAESGVDAAATVVQQQGVNVTQEQIQAAKAGARAAVEQRQTVNATQAQRAAFGAAHGALVQSQSVNVTRIQAAVRGSVAGGLVQSQSATVVQRQSAAWGGAHGSIAQSQTVTVRQIQRVARGAATGATKGAAKHGVSSVPKIQEAAQGGAYGALDLNATVEKAQSAAWGGAQGALVQVQQVTIKQVQVAALGAAKGAVSQSQQATVKQVQAASTGAAEGAVSQSQRVTIEQTQSAAAGSASGALSQSQQATVTQVQSAARGACEGVLGQITQVQIVNVVQIQIFTQVAAADATKKAVSEKATTGGDVYRDARDGGKKRVVRTDDTDRDGLSDDQERLISTDPARIDTDGDGLNDGTEALVEGTDPRDTDTDDDGLDDGREVDIGTDPTRADTDRDGIDDGEEIQQGSDPLDPNDPNERDPDDDGLTTGEERERGTDPNDDNTDADGVTDGDEVTLYGSNPLQVDSDSDGLGDGREVELDTDLTDPDTDGDGITDGTEVEQGTDPLDPDSPAPPDPDEDGLGNATESTIGTDPLDNDTDGDGIEDGTEVEQGSDPFDINDPEVIDTDDDGLGDENETTLGTNATNPDTDGDSFLDGEEVDRGTDPLDPDDPPRLSALSVSVACENVTVTNPNDVPVTVTVAGNETRTLGVAPGESRQVVDAAGDYTLTAATGDDTTVALDNETELAVDVEECPTVGQSLSVVERADNFTVSNPNDVAVTVNASEDGTPVETVDVPANDSETVTALAPGDYTLTATNAQGDPVALNGQQNLTVTIADGEPGARPSLTASVDDGTLTVANTGNASATANLTNDTGLVETLSLPANESATVTDLAAGNYTLTATANGTTVPINGNDTVAFTVEEAEPELESLNVTTQALNITIRNPNDVAVNVTVVSEGCCPERETIDGGEELTFGPLLASEYTVTAERNNQTVLVNGEESYTKLLDVRESLEGTEYRVENPLDVPVVFTLVHSASSYEASVTIPPGETGVFSLAADPSDPNATRILPGSYVQFAKLEDGTGLGIGQIDEGGDFRVFPFPDGVDGPVSANVEGSSIAVQNPNEVPVNVTVTNESGVVAEETVPAGAGETTENISIGPLEPGAYNVTAESDGLIVGVDNQPGEAIDGVDYRVEPTVVIEAEPPAELTDLDATVSDGTLALENPNDVGANATVANETGPVATIPVSPGGNVSTNFTVGNYTVTAMAGGQPVDIDGNDTFAFTVEEAELEPLATLTVTVSDEAVEVTNPNDVDAVVNATNDSGLVASTGISAGQTGTLTLAPGTYTLTATAEDGRELLLNGTAALGVELVEEPTPPETTTTQVETTTAPAEPETTRPNRSRRRPRHRPPSTPTVTA